MLHLTTLSYFIPQKSGPFILELVENLNHTQNPINLILVNMISEYILSYKQKDLNTGVSIPDWNTFLSRLMCPKILSNDIRSTWFSAGLIYMTSSKKWTVFSLIHHQVPTTLFPPIPPTPIQVWTLKIQFWVWVWSSEKGFAQFSPALSKCGVTVQLPKKHL